MHRMKQALVYQPDEKIRMAQRSFMEALGIRIRTVEETELSEPIGRLLGLPTGNGAADGEGMAPGLPVPPVTVLAGFTEEDLDGFLGARKAAGFRGMGLLSVVTPANVGWSLRKLGFELFLEHEEIRKRESSAKKP